MDLPKKHGRGGQSALRFARLRMEKRHNYVRKVAELAVQVRRQTGFVHSMVCLLLCVLPQGAALSVHAAGSCAASCSCQPGAC